MSMSKSTVYENFQPERIGNTLLICFLQNISNTNN